MRENMYEIGRVKQVQIQRSTLKVGQRPHRYYAPSPLLVVEALLVSPEGAIGVTAEDEQIIDLHHVQHPRSHNHQGINGLSLGFTSHYQAMRAKLGDQVVDGCAGENILVESDRPFTISDLKGGIAIQNPETGEIVYLTDLKVAAPCVEFSQYAANHGMPLPPEELKAALQFLDHGRRGFYAAVAGEQQQGRIGANDRVYILPFTQREDMIP